MTGGATFNEVFLTDVRIPDNRRLGPVDEGWSVALTTLASERASLGGGVRRGGRGVAGIGRAVELLRHFERSSDPILRQELAQLYIGFQVAKYTNRRAADAMRTGRPPGPEASIAKLALTRNLTATADFVARVLGPHISADTGDWGTYAWAEFFLTVPGLRIAGGTDNIQRNILAERVLGLPREPRPQS
jgi:alkylation response protein AidB-like acyl-CoA dehydrogenase